MSCFFFGWQSTRRRDARSVIRDGLPTIPSNERFLFGSCLSLCDSCLSRTTIINPEMQSDVFSSLLFLLFSPCRWRRTTRRRSGRGDGGGATGCCPEKNERSARCQTVALVHQFLFDHCRVCIRQCNWIGSTRCQDDRAELSR